MWETSNEDEEWESEKNFVPPPPYKISFLKNTDTFFNYGNYSIIYTLPYNKC